MKKKTNHTARKSLLTVLFFFGSLALFSQRSVLFEVGGSYFTNEFSSYHFLNDFAAFSFNTRILFAERPGSAFSWELPLSLRTRIKKDVVTRFALQLPVLIVYNLGSGASGLPSGKNLGLTAGVGYGYFYQKSQSELLEIPVHKESISMHGPLAQGGIRFRLKSIRLFSSAGKDVNPAIAIKFTHHFNLIDGGQNIGSLSLLLGLSF
jgi:hypothetical protein